MFVFLGVAVLVVLGGAYVFEMVSLGFAIVFSCGCITIVMSLHYDLNCFAIVFLTVLQCLSCSPAGWVKVNPHRYGKPQASLPKMFFSKNIVQNKLACVFGRNNSVCAH